MTEDELKELNEIDNKIQRIKTLVFDALKLKGKIEENPTEYYIKIERIGYTCGGIDLDRRVSSPAKALDDYISTLSTEGAELAEKFKKIVIKK